MKRKTSVTRESQQDAPGITRIPIPEAHFGALDQPHRNWREVLANEPEQPDDDELLPETPPDIIGMLGFDPLELEDDDPSKAERVGKPNVSKKEEVK
jgi:hypothetical protein